MEKQQIISKYGKALASTKSSVTAAHGSLEVTKYAYANQITFKRALREIVESYKASILC